MQKQIIILFASAAFASSTSAQSMHVTSVPMPQAAQPVTPPAAVQQSTTTTQTPTETQTTTTDSATTAVPGTPVTPAQTQTTTTQSTTTTPTAPDGTPTGPSATTTSQSTTTAPAAATTAATAADVKKGVTVYDTAGAKVGTIDSVSGGNAVLNTGTIRAGVPVTSFAKNDKGLVIATTRADIEAQAAKAKAKK